MDKDSGMLVKAFSYSSTDNYYSDSRVEYFHNGELWVGFYGIGKPSNKWYLLKMEDNLFTYTIFSS